MNKLVDLWSSVSEMTAARPNVALVGATTAAAAFYLFFRPKRKGLRRQWSFTSVGLMVGGFPTKAKVPESIINAAVYLAKDSKIPTDQEIADQVIRPILDSHERFSLVPDTTLLAGMPAEKPYRALDLVRRVAVNGTTHETTEQAILQHLQDPFRRYLPWWEILVIENKKHQRNAVVLRVQHSLADGLGLVQAFRQVIVDKETGNPFESVVTQALLNRREGNDKKRLGTVLRLQVLAKKALGLVSAAIHVLTLGHTKHDDVQLFGHSLEHKRIHSGVRDLVHLPKVPLATAKALKQKAGVSVNDIFMCLISQAIHEYSKKSDVLRRKGGQVQVRALIPVSLPSSVHDASERGNKWCLLSSDMHVGYSDIEKRLEAIYRSTQVMKTTPRALVSLWIQNTLPPLLPWFVSRQAVGDVFSRHSLVFTNVPGPDQKCLVAGAEGESLQVYFSNLLPQISLVSYAGQVHGNMIFDPNDVDGTAFVQGYRRALVMLCDYLEVSQPPL